MIRGILLALVAVVGFTLPAQACPDFNRRPSQGVYSLVAGFQPDPQYVNIRAGGRINLGNCGHLPGFGFVARSPDFSLNYTAGGYALTFLTRSSVDTVLLINDPSGRWYFDDDSGASIGAGGLAAAIKFNNPQSGRYDVWIGLYNPGSGVPVRIEVSELY
ncbi:MAG: hypothetical protein KDI98_06270 [Hyphomicrobiaceae bacterium]|nr:hypothetical protein [Hyphomicrobiaceae bacterium]